MAQQLLPFELDTHQSRLKHAFMVALDSPDPSTQVGARIYSSSGTFLSSGFNRLPYGTKPTKANLSAPLKYDLIVHAEAAALTTAARQGRHTEGAYMYATWAACAKCASLIIDAGIKRVYTSYRLREEASAWSESIELGEEMFANAGVDYVLLDHVLDTPPIRFAGKLWQP